jgi:branched-chain amino acid aminotransferase
MTLSQTWTYFDGSWHDGNPPIMGPRSHGFWLGSSVFDGARLYDGVTPDLERHFERVNRSAETMHLKALVSCDQWVALAREGIKKFDGKTPLYIKPMYWPEAGQRGEVAPDPESTRFLLCLYEAPMPDGAGSSITLSRFRRPTPETMPTEAKTGCLYPNNARALMECRARGFDNCLLTDMLGNVAELATANIFMVKDGVVFTPIPNGTFLNGITRQRVIGLLKQDGQALSEGRLTYADFLAADEIFSAGNYGKVQPITRIDDRVLQPGPIYRKARDLYADFAHSKMS